MEDVSNNVKGLMEDVSSDVESAPSIPAQIQGGCGVIHVSVVMVEDEPYRVMLQLGRSGSCHNCMLEAIARLLSWGLKAGAALGEAAQQLKGFHCARHIVGKNTSCLDGLGIVLEHIAEHPFDPGIMIGRVESEGKPNYKEQAYIKLQGDSSCPKGG